MAAATFDMTEMDELRQSLLGAPGRMEPEVQSALRLSGRRVQRRSRQLLTTRGRYTRHYRRSITSTHLPHERAVEIGPEVGRKQGALGSVLEHGSATSPPYPHLIPAAREQEQVLEGALVRIASRSLYGPR